MMTQNIQSFFSSSPKDIENHANMKANNKVKNITKKNITNKTIIDNSNDYNIKITSREESIMDNLMKFYSEAYNRNQMIPIIEQRSNIPLRALDWFVTKYSKKYNVIYSIKKGDKIRNFVVHSEYKALLKGYQKKLFDPFCRKNKIDFEYGEGLIIETSIGQLNFFKWAIENKVLDYVSNNLNTILDDLKANSEKKKKNGNKRELSINATKAITMNNVTVTIDFQ